MGSAVTDPIRQYLDFLLDHQRWQTNGGKTPAGFMIEYGRDFAFGPDSFKGRRMRMKNCYGNSAHRALGNPAVTYVEGYCLTMFPIEHAWLVSNETGRVIDPTLRGDRVQAYFGVPIKHRYLCETLLRNKVYGVLDWWNWKQVLADDPADIVAML